MLELLKQGIVPREMRLKAARGGIDGTTAENLLILVRLLKDEDPDVRTTAAATLDRVAGSLAAFSNPDDVPDEVRNHFADRRNVAPVAPSQGRDAEADGTGTEPAVEESPAAGALAGAADPSEDSVLTSDAPVDRDSILQKLTQMSVPDKVKAAVKGSREVRALLIRDPNRMISTAVLTSPRLTESEVESFARMGNVSEDVLRIIGSNRSWMKNYGVMSALVKNSKTPLAMSLNLMHRLNDRDLAKLAFDRNVMDPLRVAAKRRVDSARV